MRSSIVHRCHLIRIRLPTAFFVEWLAFLAHGSLCFSFGRFGCAFAFARFGFRGGQCWLAVLWSWSNRFDCAVISTFFFSSDLVVEITRVAVEGLIVLRVVETLFIKLTRWLWPGFGVLLSHDHNWFIRTRLFTHFYTHTTYSHLKSDNYSL